ncbi:conserved Plasmodium protein, unknown function [Plasmodium berghei]|uniref:Uncharacterized protein n=2 Tax=Plasmodium berghei TaxID=5821 RepID=A0A509AHL0_PLABA|nr:conserved protein, unknown function [Plasmodium berghei ANKA]CXI33964.1 conserved Plasmodium protein, unknown function [Plasmodium berghei]VUC55385.1 conserved protein, unknown function [Plasmodium berghei ANKA]|eukprot:XP_034421198.1 conserved protein, unknown function [Plasmodium berghei ANKA]
MDLKRCFVLLFFLICLKKGVCYYFEENKKINPWLEVYLAMCERKRRKKKKKKDSDEKDDKRKKKVNKKLMRRKLLKFYKLKKRNEETKENIFDEDKKYSVFDYIESKLTNDNSIFVDKVGQNDNKTKIDQIDNMTNTEELVLCNEQKKRNKSNDKVDINETFENSSDLLENYKDVDDNMRGYESKDNTEYGNLKEDEKQKKKKKKKLKKNMHIGKYHRKVFTYKKKIPVDNVHEYVENKQLKEKYILKKDTLKNVFVNRPLFNFYNFYNFFQIDHIEKYNKSKILNLIYYYMYKYKNNVGNEIKYDYLNEDDIKKFEGISNDKKKMMHYLEYYINMNNNKYQYINIDKNYTLKKKKTDAFTVSNINKVDSLHIHNYKVVWTIRNVKEKLFWRYREMGNIPLTTSAFSFAGKKSFKLKIWLDGHKSAKKKYVSVGLKQLENYGALDEYICFSLNGITRGPFTYLSKEYYQNTYNFCKFDNLDLKNDELQLSLFVYDSIF